MANCAEQLSQQLGYDHEVGKHILISAIAYYLDDRFNITNREILGW